MGFMISQRKLPREFQQSPKEYFGQALYHILRLVDLEITKYHVLINESFEESSLGISTDNSYF